MKYRWAGRRSTKSGFPFFLHLLKKSLFHSRGTVAPLTLKRFFILLGLAPPFLLVQLIHRFALALDDIFFRGYRSITVEEPVFMIGVPRSGTTFLHRLLSKDAEEFTSIRLWEMLFAPAIIERKFWMTLGAIDRVFGGFARKLLLAVDKRLDAEAGTYHHISLFEPEEDYFILLPIFASAALMFAFPFPEEFNHFIDFDAEMPAKERKRILGFYKGCIQRHLYVHGPEKRFLSKNPVFTAMIQSLNEQFPDAKTICNVRTPMETIPSTISFGRFLLEQFGIEQEGQQPMVDMILGGVGRLYRYPMERLPTLPETRQAQVIYQDLITGPQKTVTDLYARLGIEMTPAYEDILAAEQEKARSYRSTHTYSLGQYDLTPEQIREEYADILAFYEFQ